MWSAWSWTSGPGGRRSPEPGAARGVTKRGRELATPTGPDRWGRLGLVRAAPSTGPEWMAARLMAKSLAEELAGGDARGLDLEFRSGALVGATDATSGQTY